MKKIVNFKLLMASAVVFFGCILWLIQSGAAEKESLSETSSGDDITVTGTDTDSTPPGVGKFDSTLVEKFEELRKLRGKAYKPRTRHLRTDGWATYTNRLFLESSPYLLQHAHNPVNWYPWGDAAFETAKRLNRPVLISVGYSTCHWCHVMEEESFEDKEIAKYMNENYIAIKVDREERPDVDAIYMSALHAMGQRGGWPMTVWLTPDRKPFYGGTYIPARDGDRGAGIGFLTLLKQLKEAYNTQPDKVAEVSQNLANAIKSNLRPATGSGLPSSEILHVAAQYYKDGFDATYGGVGSAPKFPSSTPIRFLLRYYSRTGDAEILKIVRLTLEKMAAGGMYDQVGGGFHRYSTDRQWLVPHFEKMLYDNALLAMAYLEAYQVTGDEDFKRITNEILRYVKRDMTSPDGAFYSATDADSPTPSGHREEGYFFTWTPEELEKVLGKERAKIVGKYYAVSSSGNFEGRTILNTPKTGTQIAKSLEISEGRLKSIIEESKELLYQDRQQRPAPIRDEKILVAWNGLMISAYAQAGLILKNRDYIDRAVNAAQFILTRHYIKGRLFRSYKDNMAKHNAYLDDYAFFTAGLLDLYEATFDPQWLKKAIELDGVLEKHYEDQKDGGFFMTSHDHENLLAREKPAYDGAEPAGNSVAIRNLLRLGEFTTQDTYRKRADKAFKAFSGTLNSRPTALSEMLLAVDFYFDKAKEIIIVTPKGNKDSSDILLSVFRKQFLPNRILSVVSEGEDLQTQAKVIPLIKGKLAIKGKVTAFVCEKGICDLPTNDPLVFAKQIKKIEKLTAAEGM